MNNKKENKELLNFKKSHKINILSITIMKMITIINKFKPGLTNMNSVIKMELFFIKVNILIEKELKLKLIVSGLLNILNLFPNNPITKI